MNAPVTIAARSEPVLPLDSSAFADIDRHFARFIERLSGRANPELALAAALVSRSRGAGNVCLDLRTATGEDFLEEAAAIRFPEFEAWMASLRGSPVVGGPGEFKPLVLDERGRLYLHRYWEYESNLAKAILARAQENVEGVNEPLLREGLGRLFPAPAGATGTTGTDWQRVAASTAVTKKLCVISGGPGTGKTRTVVGLLALLLEQAGKEPLRIALAAPTGKAAARLQESLRKWKTSLPCTESIKARLPDESFTLHRLLGGLPDSTQFRHNAENPLPFDVVVVDEASMVDLALMAKLFAATPPAARLVLLGDKDQLASVEAGAVLGDICNHRLEATPGPLAGCIIELARNYRFDADSGILALSQAINDGDDGRALGLLTARPGSGTAGAELPPSGSLKQRLRGRAMEYFGPVAQTRDPLTALQALNRFRILCAVRQGPFGVETLNRTVEEVLAEAGLVRAHERWYAGRPVLVTRNDYTLKLFNGDVGVILPDPISGELRAWFLDADNSLRSVPPVRLPEHETVFAMTVHKSQGSEFEEVLFVLPDRETPLLTRELLYTGVTRASRRVELWFNEPALRAAIARRVERASGLREALWG
jgi:exodeoxyribonuclease V alpha subunit